MSVRDELQAIYDERGQLTPRLVVDIARPPKHPLHPRFEWNDAVAGEAWRREQARDLIQSVRIVYREGQGNQDPRSVRAYHSVAMPTGHAFYSVEDIANDPLLREIALRDMEREWKELKARYAHFREFTDLVLSDLTEATA